MSPIYRTALYSDEHLNAISPKTATLQTGGGLWALDPHSPPISSIYRLRFKKMNEHNFQRKWYGYKTSGEENSKKHRKQKL